MRAMCSAERLLSICRKPTVCGERLCSTASTACRRRAARPGRSCLRRLRSRCARSQAPLHFDRLLNVPKSLQDCCWTAGCASAGTCNQTSHTASFVALQELAQQRGRFGPAQQARVAALHQFAKDQRLRRQRGPSALERRRDTTSFEAARREWGGRTVSARGTVMTGQPRAGCRLLGVHIPRSMQMPHRRKSRQHICTCRCAGVHDK